MASRSQLKRQAEAAVAQWNKANPVGTTVVVLLDGREAKQTTTRSAAQILSGHTAVIWLEGIAGCYLLERVRRLDSVSPTHSTQAEVHS